MHYLAGFSSFAIWDRSSFEGKKSLASFNFSFLHFPCIYRHHFSKRPVFLHFDGVLYTPGENRHSTLPSEQTQQDSRVRRFLRVCSCASFITEQIPPEWKHELAAPTAPNIPCHERSQQNTCDILIPFFQWIPEGFANYIILEGECRSYIDFFNDLKDIKLEQAQLGI